METRVLSWWALAIRGLAGIVLGIAAFVLTGVTLTVLVILFAAYLFVDGAFALVAGVRGRSWWTGLQGAVGIVAGLIAWLLPGMTAVVLVILAMAWAIATGVIEVVVAAQLRRVIPGVTLVLVGGILSIVFGVALGLELILFPAAAFATIVYIVGIYALLAGITYLAVAIQLRRLGGKAVVSIS